MDDDADGEEGLRYLWDGSEKGWRVERHDDRCHLSVRLGAPLGELRGERHVVLRRILGEATFNAQSALHDEIALSGRCGLVEELRFALVEAGFESSVELEPSFLIVRSESEIAGSGSQVLLIEDPLDAKRIAEKMIAMGAPFEDLRGKAL
jgi:hypothetical protein